MKLLIACGLALAALPAAAEPVLKTEARTVSVSLDGSFDRYGESHSDELRAGLELECASDLKLGRSALDWNLELYYDHSRSKSDGSVTTADSFGADLAKLRLSRWRGLELKAVRPYLLAGAELTRLKEPDEEGGRTSSGFLSPAVGVGVELKLNRRASFNVEYRTNTVGGDRRVSGMTLGLTYAILGADEEEEQPAGKEDGSHG